MCNDAYQLCHCYNFGLFDVVMPATRFLGNEDGDDSEGEEEGGGAVEVTNVEMEFNIRNYVER